MRAFLSGADPIAWSSLTLRDWRFPMLSADERLAATAWLRLGKLLCDGRAAMGDLGDLGDVGGGEPTRDMWLLSACHGVGKPAEWCLEWSRRPCER